MRTLILVTGRNNQIMETYIPTLRKKGKYDGDILLVDYDMLYSSIEVLKNQPNIIIRKGERVFTEIASDRIRAFYESIKDIWQFYDIIMVTDGDLKFFKPIAPLFELAKENLCYVPEPIILINGKTMDNEVEFHYNQFAFPDSGKIWNQIKNEYMINAGLLVGPAKMMFSVLGWISEMLKLDSHWGADQVLLNALIYYYKLFPSQPVGLEWNYLQLNGYSEKDGKCFDGKIVYGKLEAGTMEIAILHRCGELERAFPERKRKDESDVPKKIVGVKYPRPPKL